MDTSASRWEWERDDYLEHSTDRLGDHSAARYRHFRQHVEVLSDPDHSLFSLLLNVETFCAELVALEQQTSALLRMAQTVYLVRRLRRLNGVLDAATTSLGLEETDDWRKALEEERAERVKRFADELRRLRRCVDEKKNDDPDTFNDKDEMEISTLMRDLESEEKREEAMTLLMHTLDKYRDELTGEETRTMEDALALVREHSNTVVKVLPTWFVPVFEFGSAVGLSRWGNELLEVDYKDQSRFIRDVSVWSSLNHPHVAKFLGASHVGSRWVIAHEKLRLLQEYTCSVSERKYVWRRLYEVALGLQYLHERKLACASLDVDKVFCGHLENKAMLRGIDLVRLADPSPNNACSSGESDQDTADASTWHEGVKSNMHNLGTLILNIIGMWTEKKPRPVGTGGEPIHSQSNESGQVVVIPSECPSYIHKEEWHVVEQLRDFDEQSTSAKLLRVIHDMRALGRYDEQQEGPTWLDEQIDSSNNTVDIGAIVVPRLDKTVGNLKSECSKMTISDNLAHHVYLRLENVYTQFEGFVRDQPHLATSFPKNAFAVFMDLLTRLYCFFVKNSSGATSTSLSSNVSTSVPQASANLCIERKNPSIMFSLHVGIDRLIKEYELDSSHTIHIWEPQWSRVCAEYNQSASLTTLLQNRVLSIRADDTARMVMDQDEKEEMYTHIVFELQQRGIVASISEESELHAHEQDSKSNYPSSIDQITGFELPSWFLPASEIEIQLDVELGRGSFGAVHLGKWFDTPVVVKRVLFNPYLANGKKVRTQFRREADVWFRLNHINVIKMYGACHVGEPIFVCEHASGGNLDSYLNDKGRDNRYLMWYCLLNAAIGLQYLHDNGVVHGDLKANNILVGSDDVVKLADFGLSVSTRVSGSFSEGGALGAYRWKAPECLNGECATLASDVYSFAMVMIEIVSGGIPWGYLEDDIAVKYHAKKGRMPMRTFEIGDAEWGLIERMCCFEPSERLTIDAVVVHLTSLLERMNMEDVTHLKKTNVWTNQVRNHVVAREGALMVTAALAKTSNVTISRYASDHLLAVQSIRGEPPSKQEIDEIIRSLSSQNEEEVLWALTSLGNMCATSKSTSAGIAVSGVIAFVVKFLRHGSNRQKQRAAGALLNLSENSDNITSIAAAGAIHPLVKLLEDGTDDQKTAAVGAIRNLARNSHNKTKIMEAGAVDPLLKILSGDNYDLIKAAAGALWNLSVASANTVLHAMAKSFEDFVLPDIPDGRNVEYVTAVVYTSANGHFNRNQNQDFLLIAIMILFFACVSLAIIVLVMIVVLVRAIIMALPILVCLGGIVLFVHVLSLQDTMDVHKEAAAYALSNLAENSDSNKASIAAAGAIDPLVKMLRDGTEGQKVAAAGALRNLAVNSDNKALIAQAGAIDPLVKMLSDGSESQKKLASGTLRNLAENPDIAALIVQAVAIGLLKKIGMIPDSSEG